MRNLNERLLIFFIMASFALLVGCRSKGSSNPTAQKEPMPTEYENAGLNVTEANKIYSVSNINATNIAIDIPADGKNYLLNITNKSSSGDIGISVISESSFSVRGSTAIDGCPQSLLIDDNREMATEACVKARLNFANSYKANQCSNKTLPTRAARANMADHSNEVENGVYTLYTGRLSNELKYDQINPVLGLKCKLVKVTPHAKFFVDQENHGVFGYDPQKFESWVTGSDGGRSLANVYDSYAYCDTSMYDILEENYGRVSDVDNDSKISIVITPALTSWNRGLEGLFPYETMVADKALSPVPLLPELRDMILIAPLLWYSESENRHRMINNLIHESQHAINFSVRAYSGNVYKGFEADKFIDELGFDEGCAVCSEALFRRMWGEKGLKTLYDYHNEGAGVEYTGNDKRFLSYLSKQAIDSVYPFDSSNFDYGYTYGRNGLFILYLYDRFGKDKFKRLINQQWQGTNLKNTIPMILYGNDQYDLDDLQKEWHFALQNEYFKTEQGINNQNGFAYRDWLKLENKNLKANEAKTDLGFNQTVMLKLKPTIANNGDKYRFFIKSTKNTSLQDLEINLVKLPN